MPAVTRPVALVLLVLAFAPGCGSNNTGKIVGKWKANAADFDKAPAMPGAEALVVYEFTADGKFEVSAVVNAFGTSKSKSLATGKYNLGTGNNVTLTDLSPPIDGKTRSVEKIRIEGDRMSVSGKEGKTIVLTRMSEKQ